MVSNHQNKEFAEYLHTNCLLEMAIDWIQDNLDPADVFSSDDLHTWAVDNGYVVECCSKHG